ncbi:sulfotransferase family 2 domain-containing protein [Cochlodiniinecator piscidefendens]|uniref:sulfotransferase family 2 domain-containing protein n=1 Tax=Cochlodiniinecator piscidefendens TaxID=2715756 RepID=UPI00140953B6|nr:sulfotransferase family 2 domain-containing protein [Cochlodiniinecator piscidefendens]
MGSDNTNRLFTIEKLPIRYLVIPKCACTYVKNVMWSMQNGLTHNTPLRIHDSDSVFLRASNFGLTTDEIANEEFAFTVLRNPIDRFYSLYTDKVIGRGREKFVPLRANLIKGGYFIENPNSIVEHQKNCEILIGWIAENLEGGTSLRSDSHWTPQSYRNNIIREFKLKVLLVNDLRDQLNILLRTLDPNIDRILLSGEKNRSVKSFKQSQIIDKKLRKKINLLYSDDREMFLKAKEMWTKLKMENIDYTDVPRLYE